MTDTRERNHHRRAGRTGTDAARVEHLARLEDHARARRQAIVMRAVAARRQRARTRTPA